MKRFRFLSIPLILLTLCLGSCSEDFKVDAPYKNVTIVYGLLNADSARNYIRIQKAFLDESKSALDMAKAYDSSFYTSLDVHLKAIYNGNTIADEILPRVDLKDEGYPKDTGVFFNTPSYAYKISHVLNTGYQYRIVVKNSASGEVDSAETVVISTDPNSFRITQFNNLSYAIGFANKLPLPNNPPYFTLNGQLPNNAEFAEATIRFHYVDKTATSETDHSFDYNFDNFAPSGSQSKPYTVKFTTLESNFYTVFSANVPPAPAGTQRLIDSCDIFIWAGSPEFYTYQLANGAQGGLTGDQIRPIYTNIKGANALGLFASRAVRSQFNIPIDNATVDSLKFNIITKNLNFTGRSTH